MSLWNACSVSLTGRVLETSHSFQNWVVFRNSEETVESVGRSESLLCRTQLLQPHVFDFMLNHPFEPRFLLFGNFDFYRVGTVER